MKALLITDGRPGHENQSIALCRHLGLEYETVNVSYATRPIKALSYLLDRLCIYTSRIFQVSNFKSQVSDFDLIISTGSTSFYPNKVFARKLELPNVAILNPKGYRPDFDFILCPTYDHPPARENITNLPLNLCAADEALFAEKAGEFLQKHSQQKPAVGFIIGGPNAVSEMNADELKAKLEKALELSAGHEHWVTTSPRTPKEIERVIEDLPFDYRLISSRDKYNPIPAFIQLCDRLFVTSDSASMISECASFGSARVEILMNRQFKTPNKFQELIQGLTERNAVHVFDGSLGNADCKIDLKPLLQKAFQAIL